MKNQHLPTRRVFLQQSTLIAAGVCLGGRIARPAGPSPNNTLGIAVVGVAGRGAANLHEVAHETIVAICDVDENRAAKAREQFPKARFYPDYRRMLEAQDKDIDAVVISTPDHTHAVIAMAALKAGKHVYCEKPLTHSVWEARQLTETAARLKRVTQMGNQIHAGNNYRRVVELVQRGAIGPIHEVHVWCGSVWAGGERPTDTPPVPEGLHWDLWIGPAPHRPYHPDYMPDKWRGWWDFGGGGLGDMGCHYMDLAHWALDLGHARAVEADGPPVHPEHAPDRLTVRWDHPARGERPAVRLTWYGQGRPGDVARGQIPEWGAGVLFVGARGMLIADYNNHQLLPEKDFADFQRPDPFIPESIGHHKEWTEACKTGGRTTCGFDYTGPLSETVLLGNVAYRAGTRIEWDAKNLKTTNAPEAAQYLRRRYREGWSL